MLDCLADSSADSLAFAILHINRSETIEACYTRAEGRKAGKRRRKREEGPTLLSAASLQLQVQQDGWLGASIEPSGRWYR